MKDPVEFTVKEMDTFSNFKKYTNTNDYISEDEGW
jgi:hypothetical protein